MKNTNKKCCRIHLRRVYLYNLLILLSVIFYFKPDGIRNDFPGKSHPGSFSLFPYLNPDSRSVKTDNSDDAPEPCERKKKPRGIIPKTHFNNDLPLTQEIRFYHFHSHLAYKPCDCSFFSRFEGNYLYIRPPPFLTKPG